MLSKNKIKYLCSLEQKKNRSKEQKIVLDGLRLIHEALIHNIDIEYIWIDSAIDKNSLSQNLIARIEQACIPFSYENSNDIRKIANTKNSQGFLALVSIQNLYNENLNNFDNRIVILDQISDPGNLGTIIRTCAWFGIKSILLNENSADVFNYKCIRSSMGGHFLLKNVAYISNEDINEFIEKKQIVALAADLNGEQINEIEIPSDWAIIFGSEAHGLTNRINCNKKITINNYDKMESLNVAVAAGIILNKLVIQ